MGERNDDARKIEAFREQRETRRLEFKAASGGFSRDEAMDYCVAIANEGGGELVLGMTDKLPRTVCGTNAITDLESFEYQVHQKTRLNVVAREIRTDEGRVLVFAIPPRRRGSPVSRDGKYLVRRGESLAPMDSDALAAIFAEAREPEETLLAAEDLTAADVDELMDVDAFFRLTEETPPGFLGDRLRQLEHRRLVTSTGPRWAITKAGALFLARNLSLFQGLELRRIRVLRYDGSDRLHARLDHFETRGYGIAFEPTIELVTSQVPAREVIDAGRRQLHPQHAPRAIREFLGNALVHQDLEEQSGHVVVEIFDDRLEVRNPGLPTIDVKRFVDETNARNPNLAEAMRLAGYTEIRGSGVDRALEQIESLAQRAPEFMLHTAATSAILRGQLDIAEMTDEEKIRTVYLHCCLRHEQRARLTNSSLRARLGLPASKTWQASNMIALAVSEGLIALDPRSGSSRKYAAYLPFFALNDGQRSPDAAPTS